MGVRHTFWAVERSQVETVEKLHRQDGQDAKIAFLFQVHPEAKFTHLGGLRTFDINRKMLFQTVVLFYSLAISYTFSFKAYIIYASD